MKTRFYDTPNELRIRLRKSLILEDHEFWHEKKPKNKKPILTATVKRNKEWIDVVLFLDNLPKLK